MKKILCVILALLMCAAMLAGCSSDGKTNDNDDTKNETLGNGGETNGNSGNEDPGEPPVSGEGVKITDAYTFTDPTDLDFDARYALCYGPESDTIKAASSAGLVGQYMIIYAKADKVVGSYSVYVCDTAENMSAYATAMAAMGTTMEPVEGDDTVMCSFTDGTIMEIVVNSLEENGLIPDAKAQSVIDFYVNFSGATLQE